MEGVRGRDRSEGRGDVESVRRRVKYVEGLRGRGQGRRDVEGLRGGQERKEKGM